MKANVNTAIRFGFCLGLNANKLSFYQCFSFAMKDDIVSNDHNFRDYLMEQKIFSWILLDRGLTVALTYGLF